MRQASALRPWLTLPLRQSPEEQGLLGIFEVFLDTIVLCTLTALAILVSGVPIPYGGAAGAELACAALETVFGALAPGLLTLCIALLALGTLLCWQLYGLTCARYLWGKPGHGSLSGSLRRRRPAGRRHGSLRRLDHRRRLKRVDASAQSGSPVLPFTPGFPHSLDGRAKSLYTII